MPHIRKMVNMPIELRREDELCDAVFAENFELAEKFLEDGYNPNVYTDQSTGELLLHYCAKNGHWVFYELLVNAGADTKIQDKHGLLPVDYLTIKMDNNWERVEKAVKSNDVELVSTLLENGCPVDRPKEMRFREDSLLHIAVKLANVDMVLLLLAHDVDYMVLDKYGRSPFYYAQGHEELMDIFEKVEEHDPRVIIL